MNENLFKAILAMDSYNRGYGAGIKFGNLPQENQSVDTTGTQIGLATINQNSSTLGVAGRDQAISFYGVAYNYNGGKVIAYRGTDNLDLDFLNGYGVGGGDPEIFQARMAFDFYKAVAGIGVDPRTANNISLTGHSLGGGLAGLVGAVYGKSGVLFDNMAFETSARNAYMYADPVRSASVGHIYDSTFRTTVYGTRTPWEPTISSAQTLKLQAYYVDGEFLSLPVTPGNHAFQDTPQHKLDMGAGVNLPGVDSGLFGDGRHSIASLIILLYADPSTGMNIGSEWKAGAAYFWPVLYDDDLAENFTDYDLMSGTQITEGKFSSITRTALAYSAINEGTRLFGDTGIVSFFDDANNLGRALNTAGVSQTLTAYATDISKVFVQYAGELALNKVLRSSASDPMLSGVLSYADVTNNHTLAVDLREAAWKAANNGVMPDMTSRGDLVGHIFHDAGIDRISLWKGYGWYPDMGGYFDRLLLGLGESGTTVIADGTAGRATLFVGGVGSDVVTGSNNDDLHHQSTPRIFAAYKAAML